MASTGAGSEAAALFAAGGDIGRAVADVDWSRTAVGPVEGWPQSLRAAVGVCLESRLPMRICWGPEFVMIYNDGYRPLLGSSKHPRAMGQRAAECFPDAWGEVGPILRGVLERGEATWSNDQRLLLDRNDYLEECWFDFSYSPIRDGRSVAGVLTVATETTERVLGERRVRGLHELVGPTGEARSADDVCQLAARVLDGHPDVPLALLYLASDDRRSARLAGAAGVVPGSELAPVQVSLSDDAPGPWPLAAVAASGEPTLLGGLSLSVAGSPPFEQALVLPIAHRSSGAPGGVLVAGVNPLRALDYGYREFLGLVSDQLSTTLAAARALEQEHRHVERMVELADAVLRVSAARSPDAVLEGTAAEARALTGAAAADAELVSTPDRNGAGTTKGRLVMPLTDAHGTVIGRLSLSAAPGASFTLEDKALVRQLAAVASVSLEKAQLYAYEHATAVALQRSLLPERPPKVPGVELAARYLPGAAGRDVGGDWYDVIPLGGDRVAIAIGDVVGKGIPAAATMATLRSALRAYANDTLGAGDVIARLHRLVYRLGEGLCTTLFYAVLDESSGEFSYAAAGHLSPLLVRPDGTAAFLQGPSAPPLGSLPDPEPAHHTLELPPEAILVLYTDGLVERRDRALDDGLEALRGFAASTPSIDLDRALDDLLGELLPEGQQSDDVAMLALRRLGEDCRFHRGLAPDRTELSGVRRELDEWLTVSGVDSADRDDLLIAINEAVANSVEHAGGSSLVDLRVLLDRGEVIVAIADDGRWGSPRPVPGYGIGLIRSLMDTVEIAREPTGTRVEMRRRLAQR